jgi:hypothetical protein
VAAIIGDASIVPDLQFFAEAVPQLPPARLYALWGLARLAPRSPEFSRQLQNLQNHDAVVLACHTLAPYARQALLSVIESADVPDRTRGLCMEAYARHATAAEFEQLSSRIGASGGEQLRRSLEKSIIFTARPEHLPELAVRYWVASPQERIGIVQGILLAAGVRDRRPLQQEQAITLSFGEEKRLYPWLRELLSAPARQFRSEDDLWHRVLTLSSSIDLSAVRVEVLETLLQSEECTRMEPIAKSLENALKNLRTRTPRELENLLAAWEDGFALAGFSALCKGDAAQQMGRRLLTEILPKLNELRSHPYAFVRQKPGICWQCTMPGIWRFCLRRKSGPIPAKPCWNGCPIPPIRRTCRQGYRLPPPGSANCCCGFT